MQQSLPHAGRLAGACVLLAALAVLAGCSGSGATPSPTSDLHQSRSPLAAPPASMMTPHGY